MLARRALVPEEWLRQTIDASNMRLMASLPPVRQGVILARRQAEEKDMHESGQRALRKQELVGRESGSRDWRLARGEFGALATSALSALSLDSSMNYSKKR